MKKKYFFIFFFCFFLQFSFWPALFGPTWTPFLMLAFPVVLAGKMSLEKSFFWFFLSGLLVGYFSPWPPLAEAVIFSLLGGGLFLLGKIFLWQRIGFFLEGGLLIFSKIFFDFCVALLTKILIWLNFDRGEYFLNNFVLKEYLIETVLFVVSGWLIYFLLRKDEEKRLFYDNRNLIFR